MQKSENNSLSKEQIKVILCRKSKNDSKNQLKKIKSSRDLYELGSKNNKKFEVQKEPPKKRPV